MRIVRVVDGDSRLTTWYQCGLMGDMAMTLRLTDEETQALRAAAEREGISMQEVVRKAMRQYVDDWARQRDAFLAEFARENRSLLDRLAQ